MTFFKTFAQLQKAIQTTQNTTGKYCKCPKRKIGLRLES